MKLRAFSCHDAFVALPALVLLGYGGFIWMSYWPYLDAQLQLRSPDLAGLPEDVIGFGFWTWWPFIALLFAISLIPTLVGSKRRVGLILVGMFILMSAADYFLCERLVEELIRW